METTVKKREWVKDAAIIFLAVLLVLTFFSNTIMNRSLPEVATQNVSSGSITARVRGTGTVTASGVNQVKAEDTREIRAVMVRVGQEVQAGDVLFVLGQGEASELEQAQENLRQLELSYQRSALGGPTYNYAADERKVDAAWEAVIAAQEVRDRIAAASGKELPTAELNQAKKELEEATFNRDAYKTAYDSLIESSQQALSQREGERLTARVELTSLLDGKEIPWTEEEISDPQAKVDELRADPEADPEVLAAWEKLSDATQAAEAAADALAAVDSQQLDEAQAKVDEAQARVDALQATIDEILNAAADSEAYRKAQADLDAAYETYETLQEALDEKIAADQKAAALTGLDLQDLAAQIQKAKEKLEELTGGEENQITAKVSGTIQSIECTAGDTKLKGDVLCTIEVPDQGYTLSFSVTSDQAARLRPGDTATVSNYYWGRTITATLTTIRVDPKNPQTNKLLTFDVEGDVNAGAELTLSVGQKSATYDYIVPNSAIRTDTNGSFVLKIEARNSPLGNRYYARRVAVEVLASDDNSSAITGDFGWGDYVITTSSAPVKNGDMVRLADS